MSRGRVILSTQYSADGPHLQAILDLLTDLFDMLNDRLPEADASGEPVRVQEPAPQPTPTRAVPVQEPAPDVAPEAPADDDEVSDDGEKTKPVKVNEPAPDSAPSVSDLPPPPPRAGRGSGLDAWQAFADIAKVAHSPTDGRDDIIAACERAGVIEAK